MKSSNFSIGTQFFNSKGTLVEIIDKDETDYLLSSESWTSTFLNTRKKVDKMIEKGIYKLYIPLYEIY